VAQLEMLDLLVSFSLLERLRSNLEAVQHAPR
jgi:hypothetical protein